jgi:hypothetical protein
VHLAFSACPDADLHALGGHKSEEYDCPDGKMQDAMKLDGDGPGLCSQICLSHSLFGIAKRHGVVQGTCHASGFNKFQYQAKASGVPYNVYSK